MSAKVSVETLKGEDQPPEDWREAPLSSVAEVRFSSVDKNTYPSEEPVRLCNYTDVYSNDYITDSLDFMPASATQPEIVRFGLRVGDVIITKDSETPDDIGIPAVVDYATSDLVCGYHLGLVRPNHDQVDPTFLAKQFGHHRLASYFGRQANGLTRYGLPIGAVNNAPLWLPQPSEQRAIGVVLRLLDDAIAKTEAVVAKLRQVRAGLLHDLFTRGLDGNGQLRDPVAHPEQFQDSPLGRIPEQWEVVSLASVCAHITKGATPTTFGFGWTHEGVLFLRSECVREGSFSVDGASYISELAHGAMPRSVVLPGDLLMTITGYIGRSCRYPEGLPEANINQHIARIRIVDATKVDPRFVMWALQDARQLRRLERDLTGLAYPQISLAQVQAIPLPVPSAPEQKWIVETLTAIDNRVSTGEAELKKLGFLKQGLINHLLTGRVRVPESLTTVVGP